MSGRDELPEGFVTFLFSDVEGSTRLLERHPSAYGAGIARHHELLSEAVVRNGGVVFETIGDAVYAAFAEPADAVAAAHAAQRALAFEDWGPLEALKVRMGVHPGPVERRGSHYFGPALYRCARLMDTAHGGQVVLSEAAAQLVRDGLGGDLTLVDLGRHRLKDLIEPERVFQLAGEGLEAEFPQLRSAGGRPNNLPADVKSFVGRGDELKELAELLVSPGVRVVTLTGPGGSGKSRLALRAAGELLDPFKDGVFLVGLTPLADASLVAPAIAGVLGVQPVSGRPLVESLGTHLAARELLLVLDNFEHVVDAAGDIAAIVAAAPKVRVLATSRVPLRIQGEHEVHVGPLPLPQPSESHDEVMHSPSVQLFGERAREIRGDFHVTEGNAVVVAEICRGLDGLPLAIELAAARTRLFSPEALLERMSDRLGLLTGGAADLPARQRTLRNTIVWSHDLLGRPEQELFRRLAVFSGGCSFEAAEHIGGSDVLASLSVLSEHNLVRIRWNELGEPRAEMLETIAEFARERLAESGEAEELAWRHADHFASYAELAEPALYTDVRHPWLRRLADDRDNIRAALAWAVEHDEAEVGLRILASLWLWWWTSFLEGLEWAIRVLELPSAREPTSLRAGALFTAEICAIGAGDLPAIRRYVVEAVSVSRAIGDERRLALAQALGAGAVAGIDDAGHIEDPARTREVSEEAIAVADRTGDPWVAAWARMISAIVGLHAGNVDVARTWAAEAADAFRAVEDSWSRASASMALAFALVQLGELEAARAALEGSVPALLDVGDLKMAHGCLIAHGLIARFGGDAAESDKRYREALELCVDAGDPTNAPLCLEGMAAAAAVSDPERAARLLGAARALFEAGYFPTIPGFEVFSEATSAILEDALGAETSQRLQGVGASQAHTSPLAEVAHV
jgi:predicted ATPase/class 3 adenylate cyclase